MAGRVFVVLAIDTEGPVVDPRHRDLLPAWDDVDRFVAKLCEPAYRRQVPDTEGRGLAISWFVLTWSGFTSNPVGRDLGYHRIHDHYRARWAPAMQAFGDGVYWHYHHPSRSGVANEWSTDWSTSDEYLQILNRLLVDRWYFPSVFRAGGAIESNPLSNWLEQWIPIDYSSRAAALDWERRDGHGLRVRDISDWSRAPRDWRSYHPSPDDYQLPGPMRRVIFRCPDLKTGLYSLSDDDIEAAFARAASGADTVLAAFDHDYRDRADLFAEWLHRIGRVAARYRHVAWHYANALDAAQVTLGWTGGGGPAFRASLAGDGDVRLTTDRELFGPMPYVVCRYPDDGEPLREGAGDYVREDVEADGDRAWMLRRGRRRPAKVAIAASDRFGNVGVAQYVLERDSLAPVTT